MKKDTSIQVIYIAGNGHSGSTLLDIILGNSADIFSAGELTFITRDTIMQEYCSCKQKISECKVWSQIINIWNNNRSISYEEYQLLRMKYERNKTTFGTLYNLLFPSDNFKKYCDSTLELFRAVRDVTGKSVIIDSSKSPQRIAILSKIVDTKVIHLCRDFKGVLNSAKRSSTKNIEAGIEANFPARRTWKVTRDWLFTNLATELFSYLAPTKKLYYSDYVNNPEILETIHPAFKRIDLNKSFSTNHMLAGNALRLKDNIIINPNVGFKYDRLDNIQFTFAKTIDNIFKMWS